jgi:hypothetical protein
MRLIRRSVRHLNDVFKRGLRIGGSPDAAQHNARPPRTSAPKGGLQPAASTTCKYRTMNGKHL